VLAKLLAGAREDLRDAGLADAEACADLGALQLLDVDEPENRLLALGKVADRLAHDGGALARERGALGLVLAHRRLDRVADLEVGIVPGASRRVQRAQLRPVELLVVGAQLVEGDLELLGQLLVVREAACLDVEVVAGALDLAGDAADGAGGPVLAAEVVPDRAGDARPCVLLERGALEGLKPVDCLDQRHEPGRGQVVELAMGRQLADLLRREVANHRGVGQHQAVASARVALRLPGAPERLCLLSRQTLCRNGAHVGPPQMERGYELSLIASAPLGD
jgi:hypothetical protein